MYTFAVDMYQLDGSAVTYDYTPGWFDEARIGQMTLIWNDPAGLTGDFTEGTVSGADSVTVQNGMAITASDLDYGYKMNVQVRYTDWPTQLSEEYSADNVPNGGWNGSDDYYYDDDDTGDAIIGMMVTIFVVIFIFVLISAARRGDGYAGGFGTRYVFVNHLWYPAGPDGRPRPGSVGTKTKPRPPRSGGGGFGGGSRGGGFGGGGFGGGSHCACASSCACACACACAGGGRAGCSAKNLYGVGLDETLSEKL